jgi:hypothetical protein
MVTVHYVDSIKFMEPITEIAFVMVAVFISQKVYCCSTRFLVTPRKLLPEDNGLKMRSIIQ